MREINYAKDVHIDETALDVELLRQPELTLRYGHLLAEARLEVSQRKEALEFIRATLDGDIRMNPEKYEIQKITETVVSTTITLQSSFLKKNQELQEAQYEAECYQVAVNALRDKKDALSDLVKLHGQQYFAGPMTPRNLQEEREEFARKVNRGVANAMKRKNE